MNGVYMYPLVVRYVRVCSKLCGAERPVARAAGALPARFRLCWCGHAGPYGQVRVPWSDPGRQAPGGDAAPGILAARCGPHGPGRRPMPETCITM